MTNFTRYPSYKDSGIEWLGEIPVHWEVHRLGTLGRFSASGIDKHINKNESLVKIINFTDVYSNTRHILDSSIKYMEVTTPENNRIKHLVKKGDLIFLPSSETYEDLGLAAIVDEELDNTSFSYHVIRLQFKKDIEHHFKKYLTNNNFVLSQFSSYGKGTTRKIIGRNVFKNIMVVFPPKDEQTKIASFLDEKTTKINQAIAQKERLVELLKEKKQITINDAVTKGLDKNTPLKDSGIEWLGEIPAHWDKERVKYLFKDSSIKNHGEEILLAATQTQGVVPKNILDFRTVEATVSDLNTFKLVKENNYVISLRSFEGGIEYSTYRGIISPAYTVMEALKDIDFKYFKHLFKSNLFIQALNIHKTGIREGQNISFLKFKDDFLPIPPKDEQTKIASFLDEKTTKIDKAIQLQQNYIAKLKEYKASLIDSVVRGKVRVG